MVQLKSPAEVDAMAKAGAVVADGTEDYLHDPDCWTLRTASGARAAHSEHTVAATTDGAQILTQ